MPVRKAVLVTNDPATLRLYASVFEKPRRERKGGALYPPTEFCLAAAVALRERAAILEKELI